MFLRFFGFGFLAFEVGECNVKGLVTEPDANRLCAGPPRFNFRLATIRTE
jgi:hypothetical protein